MVSFLDKALGDEQFFLNALDLQCGCIDLDLDYDAERERLRFTWRYSMRGDPLHPFVTSVWLTVDEVREYGRVAIVSALRAAEHALVQFVRDWTTI